MWTAPATGPAAGNHHGYLAIFHASWVVNQVDYFTNGATVDCVKLHNALSTLFECAFLMVAVSAGAWWARFEGGYEWIGAVTRKLTFEFHRSESA
jgi:hypothetical protein